MFSTALHQLLFRYDCAPRHWSVGPKFVTGAAVACVSLQGSALTCPLPRPCKAPRCAHKQQHRTLCDMSINRAHGFAVKARLVCCVGLIAGAAAGIVLIWRHFITAFGAVLGCYASSPLLLLLLLPLAEPWLCSVEQQHLLKYRPASLLLRILTAAAAAAVVCCRALAPAS
jgi:hypothetical protein